MITEDQIPQIVKELNENGVKPEGVHPFQKDSLRKGFSYVIFDGLGLYKVNEDPVIKVMDQEQLNNY